MKTRIIGVRIPLRCLQLGTAGPLLTMSTAKISGGRISGKFVEHVSCGAQNQEKKLSGETLERIMSLCREAVSRRNESPW